MKTIYVVEQGRYSDYHICGLFSTEELAKLYIKSREPEGGFSEYDEMSIIEMEVDSCEEELRKGYRLYFVRMTKEGDTKEVYPEESGYERDSEIYPDFYDNLYTNCYASSPEHAIKIANERRICFLAAS